MIDWKRNTRMDNQWMPIKTAPTHKRILLLYPKPIFTGIDVIIGEWEFDHYAKKPRPYWSHDLERLTGKCATRSNQPTHWMPLPTKEVLI
ncbi:MAG: hypothetical protein NUV47_01215 [Patescibacteria group bacterium]|nr:hypothetical protein [Patescibacteria group bacterium]